MGKLGVGVYRAGEDVLDAVRKIGARVVLLADEALRLGQEIGSALPGIIRVGRVYLADQPLGETLEEAYQRGQRLAEKLASRQGALDVWTGYCEANHSPDFTWEKLNALELGFTRKLHEHGYKSCIVNTSVGVGEVEDWLKLKEAMAEADFFGYHSYGSQWGDLLKTDYTWYSLRYRMHVEAYRARGWRMPPLILTESGVYDPKGWKGRYSEEEVASDYIWLGEEMEKDGYVVGTTLFLCGTPDPSSWRGFDILDTGVVEAIARWNKEHPSSPWCDASAASGNSSQVWASPREEKPQEEWYNSPNFTPGRKESVKRIILHSTRGGAPLGIEAQATIRWFLNPVSRASAHALIAYDGRLIHFVSDYDTAWHASEENSDSLGLELEQPTSDTPFSPIQYHRAMEACRWWGAIHSIPLDREHILGHEETPQGRRVGKTDPGGMWDWGYFMALLT